METTQVSITATGADGEARFDVLSLPPEFLGRFRIVRQLGSGACGTVYLAEERAAGGAVAIKFLIRPERIEHLKRFVAEGQILSRVRHPNVLAVREVCEVGDHPCIVAEYLEGGSLRERLRRVGRLPPAEAARVAVQCLSGLQALHDQGIVHRDVKPENILMNAAGVAKIADLGIAKEYGLMASRSLPEGLIGTPLYMSPEQTRADPAGVPSDVYAMGLVLYEMLSGSHPFQAQTLGQILEKQRKVPAPDLLTVVPGIPGALAVAVNASLAKAVHRRPQSAIVFAAMIAPAVPPASLDPETLVALRGRRRSVEGHPELAMLSRAPNLWAALLILGTLFASMPLSEVLGPFRYWMARPIVAIFLAIVIPTWVGWVLVSSWSGSEARRILLLAPAYVVSAVLAQLTLGLDAAPPEGRFVGLLFGSAIIGLASVSPDGYRLIGRFWMALVLISSYCYTTLMSVDMAFDRAPPETVRTVVTAKETRKMTVGRFWLEVHPEGRARRSSATARRIEVSEQVFEAASVGQPVVTTWGRGLLSYRWLRDVRPAEVDPTAMTRGAPQ